MQVTRYTSSQSHEWDTFITHSKNGTFLFLRAYMDYHADRFNDHSLMYYDDKHHLIAVLPANASPATVPTASAFGPSSPATVPTASAFGPLCLYSHQGLTYGGFILSTHTHAEQVGQLFTLTIDYLRRNHFTQWYYKAIPTIYHLHPAQDDEYWLYKHHAQLIDCSLMTAIPLHTDDLPISPSKRNNSNRLSRQGYTINLNAPIHHFWPILTANLQQRFHAAPVHTLDEMMLLQTRFPDNIRCCTVNAPDGTPLAGTILYFTTNVVKAQYTSASNEGKRLKVLDFLFIHLLAHLRRTTNHRYFDFGTSMLADSTDLNTGLIQQKEGFGGRGIVCRYYKINIK